MSRSIALAACALVVAAFAGRARAEVPPLSDQELHSQATDVVVGKVQAIYRTERTRSVGHRDEVVVAEVLVSAVDKGFPAAGGTPGHVGRRGPTMGQVVYVRWWRASQRPSGWAGPSGMYVEVSEGANARFFLAQDPQGVYEVLRPNGVKVLEASDAQPAPPAPPQGLPPQPPDRGETAASLSYDFSLLLQTIRAGDDAASRAAIAQWWLPDAAAWFRASFGDERGARGTEEYAKATSAEGSAKLLQFLTQMAAKTAKDPLETAKASEGDSASYAAKVASRMKQPTGLWRASVGGDSMWFFVFVDGRWRLVGKMRAAAEN